MTRKSEDLNEINIETFTLEQYLALNRNNLQVGVKRLEIEKNIIFEIKSQLLRELRENTFSGGKTEDAMEHVLAINFDVIDNIEGPGDLEEFLMDDDLNGDLVEEFQDSDDNLGIGIDDFIAIDDL
ncbi:hypothetical protein Tco_1018580 [Tanacetum coccineum]|uniref:Uncharacterized protein n=1 Tax=Tanacetum coccineum TaxID=301880 RepID=A0ABQ5FUS2_9ASTR